MGKIELTRESVCMGDDCLAPNPGAVEYVAGENLTSVMFKIAKYVPAVHESIWEIRCDALIVGHIIFVTAEDCRVYLDISDCAVTDLHGKWFCKYHPFSTILRDSSKLPSDIRATCTDYLTMLRAIERLRK